MKKTLLSLLCAIFTILMVQAQTNVSLQINHLLGNESFAMDMPGKNNLGNDFEYTRVQYYISEITLIHDGGVRTPITDTWLLVSAEENTAVDLGMHDVTNLEKITFYIGVDPDHNHLDPATWPSGHALAPVFPSMHWGWAAGYRFIALEGNGGPSFNQNFQLHGLGDRNYFQTEVEMDLTAENNALNVVLDADYAKALENINVNSGVIVHGETLEAKEAIENFRDYVFSKGAATSSTKVVTNDTQMDVFPNPATGGTFTLVFNNNKSTSLDLSILDIAGKEIERRVNVTASGSQTFNISMPGLYTIRVISDRGISIKKVIIQ